MAGQQDYPRGCLYVVATPIGNLADISLRALHALALADAIACEDTRTSGAFLRHFGLEKPLLALHEHNERAGAAQVCARLAAGERVAYISDAGTPAVSDPGAVLVQVVRRGRLPRDAAAGREQRGRRAERRGRHGRAAASRSPASCPARRRSAPTELGAPAAMRASRR